MRGVGSVTVFGARDYAMRVWLDPDRLQSLGLTTGDVVTALQGQNVQVASGVLNQPPIAEPRAFQVAVRTLGRLIDPNEFAPGLISILGAFEQEFQAEAKKEGEDSGDEGRRQETTMTTT